MVEDEQWMVNTLEVIVQHYKELEDKIREIRQKHEGILRKYKHQRLMDLQKALGGDNP